MQPTAACETSMLLVLHVALPANEHAMHPTAALHFASSAQHFDCMHLAQSPGSRMFAHPLAPPELVLDAPPLASPRPSLLHAQGTSASAPATKTHPVARMSSHPPSAGILEILAVAISLPARGRALPSGAK
jgi:hypothetical protein